MAARAIWKGVIHFGAVRVPVKLYSAIEDRSVHFRLLHRKDRTPVRQVMVNPDSDAVVPYEQTHRGYVTGEGQVVMLDDDDHAALEPSASRDIEIVDFLPPAAIDHRWYARPYYLGPDGAQGDYFALAGALADAGKEGLARWVMRKKEYVGALRLHQGYPTLVSLRHAEEVVSLDAIEPPRGSKLDDKELSMARQLISTLDAPFEPQTYQDEHRERILDLIETKRRGNRVKVVPHRRARASEDIGSALEASLKAERKRA